MLSFTINDLLAQARKIGASDLHVAAGAEAKCRVHGELRKITREPLSAADTAELIMPMVPERLRASLDETGEADFSHAIPGNGRFRVNVLKQKGALGTVIRLISTGDSQCRVFGAATVSRRAYQEKAWTCLSDRTDR